MGGADAVDHLLPRLSEWGASSAPGPCSPPERDAQARERPHAPGAQGQSHSARWAQGLAERAGGDGPPLAEREATLQIADAIADAIRRTEERSAARYERALALLLRQLDPALDAAEAQARVKRAWSEAAD